MNKMKKRIEEAHEFYFNNLNNKNKEEEYNEYEKEIFEKKIIPIIENRSKISLRLLDYFLTVYINKNKTIIDGNNILEEYKINLIKYKKVNFDIFRRKNAKPTILHLNNYDYNLYICQKNIYKFIINNKIIEYIEEFFNLFENKF